MVQAMKALWTNDEAEFHGQLIDFPPSISMPHPKQQPHPPVLIGGGPANLDRVVAYGDGWCPGFLPPGAQRVVLCVNKPGTPDEFSDFRLVPPGESDDFLERLGDRIFL